MTLLYTILGLLLGLFLFVVLLNSIFYLFLFWLMPVTIFMFIAWLQLRHVGYRK